MLAHIIWGLMRDLEKASQLVSEAGALNLIPRATLNPEKPLEAKGFLSCCLLIKFLVLYIE